jgi:hypothetical protein
MREELIKTIPKVEDFYEDAVYLLKGDRCAAVEKRQFSDNVDTHIL